MFFRTHKSSGRGRSVRSVGRGHGGARHAAPIEALEGRRLLASAGQLLSYNFNAATAWPLATAVNSTGVTATSAEAAVGTIDTESSTTKTGAINLNVSAAPAGLWSSELSSGLLALSNTETSLAKLTLAFDLSASVARQVKLHVYSHNAQGQKTGGLETTLDPAAPNYFQRFAVDLSTMKAHGPGAFVPTAPFISIGFEVTSLLGWSASAISPAQVRVDNVYFAKPAYYVKPTGSNSRDGRSETNAFSTPQKALDVSQPGDIILIMEDATRQYDYTSTSYYNMLVTRAGSPAAWVTVKNYPGHTPTIYNTYWDTIRIGSATTSTPTTIPAVSYIEIRGLSIRGNADTINTTNPELVGQVDSRTNNNGISVDGRSNVNKPHHIRIADNTVQYMSGGGIGAGDADHVQFENNTVRNTSWWTRYATSGFSILSAYNFDGTSGGLSRLVRGNVASGNQCFQVWVRNRKDANGNPIPDIISDGNGIIIDLNRNTDSMPTGVFRGRTLVTNNLSFNNGGSGIHAYKADHVDIINNTAYLNSASPALQYAQIHNNSAFDVRMYNNIMVAPVPAPGQPAESANSGTVSYFRNNVYSGGSTAPLTGTGDQIADPKFVAPSIDPAAANFTLQPTSPAINAGNTVIAPTLDVLGNPRVGNPDAGAYEYYGVAPVIVTAAQASPVVNNAANLGVFAADDAGFAGLTYAWSVLTRPAGAPNPIFTDNFSNSAALTSATFNRAGTYLLAVAVTDAAGNSTSSTVSVTVAAVLSGITVTPAAPSVAFGGSLQITAGGIDQFGQPMGPVAASSWSVTGPGNTIDPNGLFTAGQAAGTFTVTATAAAFTASAPVSVTAPVVAPPVLTAVESYKTHGTAGTFARSLPLTGLAVEPRYGGVTRLDFAFTKPIRPADGTLDADEFVLTNVAFASASISGSILTVNLTGAVTAQFSTVALAGLVDAAGTPISGTAAVTVGNLYGDLDSDGTVTPADVAAVTAKLYKPLSATDFLFDLDASGFCTIADPRAASSRLGTTLPAPRP